MPIWGNTKSIDANIHTCYNKQGFKKANTLSIIKYTIIETWLQSFHIVF